LVTSYVHIHYTRESVSISTFVCVVVDIECVLCDQCYVYTIDSGLLGLQYISELGNLSFQCKRYGELMKFYPLKGFLNKFQSFFRSILIEQLISHYVQCKTRTKPICVADTHSGDIL